MKIKESGLAKIVPTQLFEAHKVPKKWFSGGLRSTEPQKWGSPYEGSAKFLLEICKPYPH